MHNSVVFLVDELQALHISLRVFAPQLACNRHRIEYFLRQLSIEQRCRFVCCTVQRFHLSLDVFVILTLHQGYLAWSETI